MADFTKWTISVVLFDLHLIIIYLSYITHGQQSTTRSSLNPDEVTSKDCSEEHTEKVISSEYYSSVCTRKELDCNVTTLSCVYKTAPFTCRLLRYREVTTTSVKHVCCHGYRPDATGKLCVRVCPSGTYGQDCDDTCTCLPTQRCDPYSGQCTCYPGYTGPGCVNVCEDKLYGVDCNETCVCQWSNAVTCSAVNGSCWCRPGWIGNSCGTECPKGSYGHGCLLNCTCSANQTCNQVDGDCACATGYTGINCTEEYGPSARADEELSGAVLIAVEVILGVIVFAAVLAFVIHCVRKQQHHKSYGRSTFGEHDNAAVDLTDCYKLDQEGKKHGKPSPRRSHAPNGDLYTEVDKPTDNHQDTADPDPKYDNSKANTPYEAHASTSSAGNSTANGPSVVKYVQKNGTGPQNVTVNTAETNAMKPNIITEGVNVDMYADVDLDREDKFVELGKDNKAKERHKDQYDHVKPDTIKPDGGDTYDELEKNASVKKDEIIGETYDHTRDFVM